MPARVTLPIVTKYPHALSAASILDPWSITETGVRRLGKNAERGKGVVVGINDTGLSPLWQANVGQKVVYVASAFGRVFEDGNGHGSHVAGTLAGWQGNEQGPGIAPGATVHIGRSLDDGGGGTDDGMAAVTKELVDSGCHFINLSAGSEGRLPKTEAACQYAFDKGCLVFVASGNFGPSGRNPLAELDCVFSVAALNRQLQPSSFSSPSSVDGCAPGEQIESFYRNGMVNVLGGTSMAAPWQAGIAAIVQSNRLKFGMTKATPQEIVRTLWGIAEDRGEPGDDPLTGKGMMSVAKYEESIRTPATPGEPPWVPTFMLGTWGGKRRALCAQEVS